MRFLSLQSVNNQMKEQLAEARQLLRHKRANLRLLDQQLEQELTTQQLLQQIMSQQSASLSQSQLSKQSNDYSESPQISNSSTWLLAQVQRASQFVDNCMLAGYAKPQPLKRAQFPTQPRAKYSQGASSRASQQLEQVFQLEEAKWVRGAQQLNQQHYYKKPLYIESIAPIHAPETQPTNHFVCYPPQRQQPAFRKPLQSTIRQELLRQQRDAIRRSILEEQTTIKQIQHAQAQYPKHLKSTIAVVQLQSPPLTNAFQTLETIECIKRRRAMARAVAEIKRAKEKGSRMELLIARQSAVARF